MNPLLRDLDRVVYVAGGRIVSGRPEDVITSETLSALYGVPVEVLRTSDGQLVVVGTPEAPAHHSDRHGTLTRREPAPLARPVSDFHQLLEFPFMVNALEAGDDRRADGGGGGLVHGAPPAELRRATRSSVMSFPGASGAALAGIPLAAGYFASCAARRARDRRRRLGERTARPVQESAIIGTVQVAGLALGFLFLSLYGGVLESLETLLFGSFLGITHDRC